MTRFRRSSLVLVMSLVGLATVLTSILGDGDVAAAVAPVVIVAGVVAVMLARVRVALLTLTFFGLALDRPQDGGGREPSPLAPLGRLLTENLNKTLPIDNLRVSIFAILVVCAVLI